MAEVYAFRSYSVTGHAGPAMLRDYAWARDALFSRATRTTLRGLAEGYSRLPGLLSWRVERKYEPRLVPLSAYDVAFGSEPQLTPGTPFDEIVRLKLEFADGFAVTYNLTRDVVETATLHFAGGAT